jgi:Rrf2 family protein
MKLSEGIEWAIHCCSLMAALPEGTSLPGTRLSEFFDLPKDYLAKHLQALSRAGIVETSRGPRGGYRLAKPAAKITLLHIVEAIDGKDPCFQCTEIRQRGPSGLSADHYKKPCGIARAMRKAEHVWRTELNKVDIASLVAQAAGEIAPQQALKAADWFAKTLR